MTKFAGIVGYATQAETSPGVWENVIEERTYRGDILQNNKRWENSEMTHDDLRVDNKISIVADPYANDNFQHIRYIKLMGSLWTVTKIEIARPRLILTTGGLYNGNPN